MFVRRIQKTILPALLLGVISPGSAWATDVTQIAQTMTTSGEYLPGVISAFSYLLALLFGFMGILRVREHVENPRNLALKDAVIPFIAGGALLALPIIYESMANTVGAGGAFGGGGFGLFSVNGMLSGALGALVSWAPGMPNFNQILDNIVQSFSGVPGLLSAGAYLLGLLMGVSAVLKVKEHVESPQNTPLREAVIRFIVGGGMFALPVIFTAMRDTISTGGPGAGGIIASILGSVGTFLGIATCGPATLLGGIFGGLGGAPNIGAVICNVWMGISTLPAFLSAASYLFGLVLGIWGLMKLKEHVLNPSQVSIWEPIQRFIAGGAFFALPAVASAMQTTIMGTFGGAFNYNTTGTSGTVTGNGLDAMMASFVGNIYGPMSFLMNWFGFAAGTVLIMIGISRLLKSAQEGPRGPGGLGTIMTFLVGGAFMSFGPLVGAFSTTLFGNNVIETAPDLVYMPAGPEKDHVNAVLSAIIQFMIVVGLVSFARGIFIIRDVAEGDQQASLMAGVTHLLGGAMAVNLGPVMNAVQATLGLTAYGVNFT